MPPLVARRYPYHSSHAPRLSMRLFPRVWTSYALCSLLFSGALATGCGAGAATNWYYHWNCNGDADCLATNPTGAASGTLDEGPDQVNCTQLMVFASHFWGPAAFNSC